MKNYFLLLGLLIAVSPLWSQNYKPGYIVTLEKDTIQGSLITGTDSDLSRIISFKRTGGTSEKYEPVELIGFGFNNGRIFERKMAVLKTEDETDSTFVFAKNLVRGKIDLLVLRFPNRVKPDIFLSNNSTNKTVQLSNPEKMEVTGQDGEKYLRRDYKYAGKLDLIKGEEVKANKSKPVRFSEKKIKKDILAFNENFQQEFPINVYEEEKRTSFDILVGIPIKSSPGSHFRVGVYRNKINIEKTSHLSLMQGIVFHHYNNEDMEIPSRGNVNKQFKTQLLNIIPIGIKYRGNFGILHPYIYAGVGLAAGISSFHVVENSEYIGDENDFLFSPTINFGIGAKVRIKEVYLITELTPTYKGIFFNLGISI